jgi:outer membrane protein OmpA-like peptidoglycan-associated protein/opacity protein-like surface antigen
MSMVASAGAVEWNGKFGIGLRGPVLAPLLKGAEYRNFEGSYEQFMMGWNGGLDVKYGVTRNLVLNLSGAYSLTYDDATATADQSFKLNKSDNAYVKMTGIRLGLEGQYYFLPEGNVQPYLLLGIGTDLWKLERQVGGSTYNFSDLGGRVGAGINFWIGESFALDLQGKLTYDLTSISTDDQTEFYGQVDWSDHKTRPFRGYLEPSVGFTYFFGGARDTDQDGIKDKFDQCPDTPFGALVDQYGCPLDNDGDGVYDGLDACSDTPTGAVVDITGCPLDTDKDGIFDGLDKCPDTPLDVAVDVRGCPLDTDGDGVPDFKDKQPDTPAGAVVDVDGVALDADGDGVPDGIDKCPDTPIAVLVDELGCPLAKPLTEKIVLNIKYAPGSFQPDKEARVVLDKIVETMRAYLNLNIEINGYTDALGSATGNLKLSQKRADTVMQYLRDQGVAAERMIAQGYGEDAKFFVGDNSTEEGRQKNRRVEIVPVQQ